MSHDESSRIGSVFGNDAVKIAIVLAGIYALFLGFGAFLGYSLNGYVNMLGRLTLLIAVYALSVLALNLQWGYTGLFNIGVAGFMAVGAYTMAMLTTSPTATVPGLGLPLIVGVVGGMVAAALVGLLAALPALRLRADYLAIVTIALSEVIRYTYLLSPLKTFSVFGVQLGTGGGGGFILSSHPADTIPGFVLSTDIGSDIASALMEMGIERSVIANWIYVFVLVAVVAVVYWLLMRIGFSPFGRVLKAIREDEDVAKALGKNSGRFKIKSFMVGCALMGLAGILWQAHRGFLSPNAFRPIVTFFIWIALIIGGAGSNTGTVLGGALFVSLLFQAPRKLATIIRQVFNVSGAPPTFAEAVGPLISLNVEPLVAYALGNVGPLRFVLVGLILVWLMQNRPQGLLGHRKEVATSIGVEVRERNRPSEGTQMSDIDTDTDTGSKVETDTESNDDDTEVNAVETQEQADEGREQAVEEAQQDVPLHVERLRKSFGGITAVDDASFSVEQGTLTGLIGPNGAGKSTTFNLITGFHEPDDGYVSFNDADVTGLQPYTLAEMGLVRTFQIARELSEMTVLENMMLAPQHQPGEALWRPITPGVRRDVKTQEENVLDRAWETLEFFDISHLAEEYAGNLSGGQRKLLELARALMTDPDVLLLDEPFAGVNPTLEARLLEHIHDLSAEGYTFLIVEHDMDLIMEHCEHVIVMHQGTILSEGSPEEIMADERVIEAYLGENV